VTGHIREVVISGSFLAQFAHMNSAQPSSRLCDFHVPADIVFPLPGTDPVKGVSAAASQPFQGRQGSLWRPFCFRAAFLDRRPGGASWRLPVERRPSCALFAVSLGLAKFLLDVTRQFPFDLAAQLT
jgi:hypothetical protein